MPQPFYADRVQQASYSPGTGAYTLDALIPGFQGFAGINGQTVYYEAHDVDANGIPIGGWEVGRGVVSSGSLSRATILASSNGNAAVNWGTGTRRVFVTQPAAALNAIGQWTDVAFAASDFGALGGGSWTVAASAVRTNRYTRLGQVLIWQIYIDWQAASTIAGAVSYATVKVPGGLTLANVPAYDVFAYGQMNAVATRLVAGSWGNETFLRITPDTFGAVAAGLFGFSGTLTFGVL
jgi:hypothetical protein